MRDRETVEIGLSAAENRPPGPFDPCTPWMPVRLSTVSWVCSNRRKKSRSGYVWRTPFAGLSPSGFCPRKAGAGWPLSRSWGNNLNIKDMILNGESEDKTFYNTIKGMTAFGFMTFDQSILELYREGKISEDTAMAYSSKKAIVGRGIDIIKAQLGEKTTDIDGLTMDVGYTN